MKKLHKEQRSVNELCQASRPFSSAPGPRETSNAILVMDCGTSGVKSTLVVRRKGPDEPPIFLKTKKFEADNGDAASGKERIWQPVPLLKQFTEALLYEVQRARDENIAVVALSITSTTSSTVTIKEDCVLPMPPPLRWDDSQGDQEAANLEKIRADAVSMPWLQPIMPDSGLAKAVWLISNYPREFMTPGSTTVEQWSFLNWFLTEKRVQCETILARKWGWTISVPWPEKFRTALGHLLVQKVATFAEKTPKAAFDEFRERVFCGEVKPAGEAIGPMSWRLSRVLGFAAPPQVFSAPFDTFAQILGMGAFQPNDSIAITFGTSQAICAVLPGRIKPKPHTYVTIPDAPIRGLSMLFDGIASCGGAVRFVCENYGFMTPDGQVDYTQIGKCLLGTEPGAQGIVMLPYYNGGRRVSRGGRVYGMIEGLNQGKPRANIVRALFESICYITEGILNDFENSIGRKYTRVLVSGGPTTNDPFMQMLASVLKREVVLFKQTDASLVGCAICAAKGLNWYTSFEDAQSDLVQVDRVVNPDPAQVRAYEELCRSYLSRFSSDIPLFNDYVKSS